MGRKVHPLGFRIGVIRDWQAKWYGGKHYLRFLQEDLKLRGAIRDKYADASISLVEIDRQANKILVTIHTARPGVVIGRGGQRVDEIRQHLESLIGGRVQLNIQEIRQPELDAYLVARSVADQIEHRIAFRRAMKRAVYRTLEAGAKGVRITCAGRLGGTEIARREMRHQGQVPLHKLRADIDYGLAEARTTLGRIGVKVWIYRGDILPQVKAGAGEAPAEAAAKPAVSEAKVEKVPAEPTAEVSVEAEPSPPAEVVETKPEPEPAKAAPAAEEKPVKRVRKAKKVEAVKAAPAAEEKPVKRVRKAKKAEAVKAAPAAEEKPVKRVRKTKKAEAAKAAPAAEEKPVKRVRKTKKAEAAKAAPAAEKKDATT